MNELKKVKMGKLIRGIVVFPVIFGVLLLGAGVALLILKAGNIPTCIVFGVFIVYVIASLIFYL
ncbi:MAG: hypothetical protein HUJ75_06995, partial [Parasporobacterium sp.]|nr:hypothetical protein [Parasporobacterium sp.]